MCGLCGMFGGDDHWSHAPNSARMAPTRAERERRATIANEVLRHYRLRLNAWTTGYTLASATGKTTLVQDFGMLWAEAERLTGQACDPLDPDVIARLERNGQA